MQKKEIPITQRGDLTAQVLHGEISLRYMGICTVLTLKSVYFHSCVYSVNKTKTYRLLPLSMI